MELKRNYFEDIQLLRGRGQKVGFAILAVLLAAAPFVIEDFYLYMINLVAVHAIVAVGLNILVGYTGQISLGHAGFFAIGAYVEALAITKLSLPMVVSLPAAGGVAAVFGFLLGLPSLRLSGPYLAIATLGFGMGVTQIIGHSDFFGGRMGISVPKPEFLGDLLSDDQRLYFVIVPICVAATAGAASLVRSKLGRAFIAIRDNEIAAETMGIDLMRTKTLSFAISAFYTGIAGGLMGHLLGFINPEMSNLISSVQFLAMVVVGGLGSILGSILGAILMTILPQLMSGLQHLSVIVYGAIMVLVIMFEPLGLRGRWLKAKIYFKTWPF